MDASDAKQPFLPNGLQHVVLTQDGLRLVVQMEPRLILDISKEDIEDKEKANGLAKFIVCFQALWFCIVCIARVAQGLQISILELNVFAHAICTLLIYLLWWDKPLDFQEPTLIRGEDAHPICAFFSVMKGSLGDDALPWQKAVSGNFSDKEIIVLSGWGRTSNNASIESDTAVLVEAVHTDAVGPGSTLRLPPDHAYYNIRVSFRYCDHPQGTYIELDEIRSRLWRLASEALQKCPNSNLRISSRSVTYIVDRRRPEVSTVSIDGERPSFAVKRRLRSDLFKNLILEAGHTLEIASTLAGFIYGGLHSLAWTAPFASHTHRILWQISGVAIAATGPAAIAISVASQKSYYSGRSRATMHEDALLRLSDGLVVECFLNIARLPEGVYRQPNWS